MRNRYFARSRPDSWPHDRRCARRAARTALSTSTAVALAICGQRLLGGRVDRDEGLAAGRLDLTAVDEQAVALLELDDVAGLGRRARTPTGWPGRRPGPSCSAGGWAVLGTTRDSVRVAMTA